MKTSLPPINATLVIPLFNNEDTLYSEITKCITVLKQVTNNYEIIICDDKSTDSSALLLKKYFSQRPNIKLLFNTKNQGIAKTLLSLYKKAKYEYIILFSVDGDWNPKDIALLLLSAQKHRADIVIGKRTYTNYSLHRKIISFFYNFLPVLFFDVKTIDAGSIKAMRRDTFRRTKLISKDVFFEAELIIRSSKQGKKIIDVPIHFKKRRIKQGKGGKFSLIVGSLIDLINLRVRL